MLLQVAYVRVVAVGVLGQGVGRGGGMALWRLSPHIGGRISAVVGGRSNVGWLEEQCRLMRTSWKR